MSKRWSTRQNVEEKEKERTKEGKAKREMETKGVNSTRKHTKIYDTKLIIKKVYKEKQKTMKV